MGGTFVKMHENCSEVVHKPKARGTEGGRGGVTVLSVFVTASPVLLLLMMMMMMMIMNV
jgi:hypothetical protein